LLGFNDKAPNSCESVIIPNSSHGADMIMRIEDQEMNKARDKIVLILRKWLD
jgi:hypothetical protein